MKICVWKPICSLILSFIGDITSDWARVHLGRRGWFEAQSGILLLCPGMYGPQSQFVPEDRHEVRLQTQHQHIHTYNSHERSTWKLVDMRENKHLSKICFDFQLIGTLGFLWGKVGVDYVILLESALGQGGKRRCRCFKSGWYNTLTSRGHAILMLFYKHIVFVSETEQFVSKRLVFFDWTSDIEPMCPW